MGKAAGTRFKKLRAESGLDQPQFAEALGVFRSETVSRWENGHAKPKPRQIRAIADVTGATVADVESWYETGKPELHWRATPKPDTGRGVAGAGSDEADAETEEMERSLAYWHWRTQLTPEDRKRARTVYIRVVDRGKLPPPPRAWEPGSAGQRKG